MKFGETARDIRVGSRKPLSAVAEELGYSAVYISDIERGNRNPPPPSVARKWAEVIGGDPLEFERLALLARKAVELEVDQTHEDALVNQAAFALARRWKTLDEPSLRKIIQVVEEDEDDEFEP